MISLNANVPRSPKELLDEMEPTARQKAEAQREHEILRELCTCNGLTLGRLQQDGPSQHTIEMFFSGYPSIIGLQYFPNLTVLTIIGQPITRIENLSHCIHLREVWLAECQIKRLEGLEKCSKIRKLYVYSNFIDQIENINHLHDLQILWIHDNQLNTIEGLTQSKYLRELNVAENNIEKISFSLNGLQNLEKLEISGNLISSFKDITNLHRLPSLRELGLKSAEYAPNPIGLLCNYSTHILYHLTNILRLDNQDISNKSLRELAEMTVSKKKMFYNMKVKTLRRDLAEMRRRLLQVEEQLQKVPFDRMRALIFMIKEIDREMRELKECDDDYSTHDSETEGEAPQSVKTAELTIVMLDQLKEKQRSLKDRVKVWEKRCSEIKYFYEEAYEKMRQATDATIHRLVVELETGGNIRFEDGKPSDVWFSSCHDLVLSRFCVADYRDYGVVGIKIHRVTRIHNRILRMQFDECLANIIEDEDNPYQGPAGVTTVNGMPNNLMTNSRGISYKKSLEYLFWVHDPEVPGGLNEPGRILEEGFMDAETYKKLGKEGAVPLTNSLNMADKQRMCYVTKQAKGKELADPCPFRHGQVVISKVFLGKTQQYVPQRPIEKAFFMKADTVFRPKKDVPEKPEEQDMLRDLFGHLVADLEKAEADAASIQEAAGSSAALNMGTSAEYDDDFEDTESDGGSSSSTGENSSVARCECSSRQCEWYAFNHQLVLPEYVVDFEYITRAKPKSPFASFADNILDSKDFQPEACLEELASDDEILNMPPEIKPRPRHIMLTEELLVKTARNNNLGCIKVLNLHGNGLTKLKHLQSMPALRKLVISFNELSKLEDVVNLNLEYLDVSFNKLTTLEGIKNLNKLTHLDVSWNQLFNTRDDISVLRKHVPTIQTLDLRHNQWQKPEGLRLRAIGRIRSLTKLNGVTVSENEATAALRMAAGSRISQVSLLAHSRTDTARPRTLSLMSYAQFLAANSRCKPDRSSEADSYWYSMVTALTLDGQHISKVSNLDRLENLRWASFNDNDITKIEGLDSCVKLEELSFENNCLTKIDGLVRLTQLRRLSLGHNYITTLDDGVLEKLSQLQYLSLENNHISSLAGLQRLTSLIELYMANNEISNVREVFYLKNLPNLVILDLHGNPVVTSTESYRLFVIYHLRSLKALDGIAIESMEGSQARDTFGGRLTPDFVAERLGHANFSEIRELEFPQCNIRTTDLGTGEYFMNLRSVNLENNNLTSFSGLIYLVNLRVLCLNHNHIECVVPRPKQNIPPVRTRYPGGPPPMNPPPQPVNTYTPDAYTPLLENLEVLHLGYNGIKDMGALQLCRLVALKALFLQGNEITKVEGLEGLQDLRELVLDRNKIKSVSEYSFASQWNLQELHMEENRIRDLSYFGCLENLQRLFLGMNRIQDINELEKLESLPNIIELSVVSNAVARRLLHRPMLVYRMPQLLVIDGIPVSDEERTKAELYFMEQQPAPQMTTTVEATLPGIGHYKTQIPVKVTNMQLLSGPFGPYTDKTFGGTLHFSEDLMQQDIQRGGGRKRQNPRSDSQGVMVMTTSSGKTPSTMTYPQSPAYQPTNSSNLSSRSQHQLSQVPYVPYQPQGNSDYVGHTESLTRINKNNRR